MMIAEHADGLAQRAKERDRFAADLHDAAAEMRCRATQLRSEAEALERNAARIMDRLYDAGVLPRPTRGVD